MIEVGLNSDLADLVELVFGLLVGLIVGLIELVDLIEVIELIGFGLVGWVDLFGLLDLELGLLDFDEMLLAQ